jgi:hypothetical protein
MKYDLCVALKFYETAWIEHEQCKTGKVFAIA